MSVPASTRGRAVRLVGVIVAAAIASVLSPLAAALSLSPTATAADANPLALRPLFVDPQSWASWAAGTLPLGAAEQLAALRIARVPQARWLTDSDDATSVDRYVSAAQRSGSLGVLVLYAIPNRDCHGYSAGGLPSTDAYRAWVQSVRSGIGGRPITVIVEPDAITSADCLSEPDRSIRLGLLQDAVRTLRLDPRTTIYLDAGHSRWLSPAELARRLTLVGVQHVRGFSLNVSNFLTTAEEIAYGEEVSRLLGGSRYVVDTSRNGLGPAPDTALNWCNPEGRALGALPVTVTAGAHADAYLWIKRPGESDGSCRAGEPGSGSWFATYAAGLVARS